MARVRSLEAMEAEAYGTDLMTNQTPPKPTPPRVCMDGPVHRFEPIESNDGVRTELCRRCNTYRALVAVGLNKVKWRFMGPNGKYGDPDLESDSHHPRYEFLDAWYSVDGHTPSIIHIITEYSPGIWMRQQWAPGMIGRSMQLYPIRREEAIKIIEANAGHMREVTSVGWDDTLLWPTTLGRPTDTMEEVS